MDDSADVAVEPMTDAADTSVSEPDPAGRWRRLRPVLWRLHFLGGILAGPVIVSLAVTGILFAWSPQIEQWRYGDVLSARSAGPPRSLVAQVDAALAVRPGWQLLAITPGENGRTTGVTLGPPAHAHQPHHGDGPAGGAVTVYVDPASARVTGQIAEASRPEEWLRSLHSSWRLGPRAEPITELAASWAFVALLTGVVLWWPRERRPWRALLPRLRAGGRRRWRDLHAVVGVWVALPLLAMIVTGLTWTTYAGGWLDALRSAIRAETPTVDVRVEPVDVPVGFSPDPTPDRALAVARAAGLTGPVQLTPPPVGEGTGGFGWKVTTLDERWPIERTTITVHPVTGRVVDRVDFDDYPLLAKLTTWGILFHEGVLFGLANQIGVTLLALVLIMLVIAGYRMWWQRRPAGAFGAPPEIGPLLRTVPVPLLAGFGVLLVLLPTLGVAFVVFLLVEQLIHTLRPPAATVPPAGT